MKVEQGAESHKQSMVNPPLAKTRAMLLTTRPYSLLETKDPQRWCQYGGLPGGGVNGGPKLNLKG